jgi:hypothetical protein
MPLTVPIPPAPLLRLRLNGSTAHRASGHAGISDGPRLIEAGIHRADPRRTDAHPRCAGAWRTNYTDIAQRARLVDTGIHHTDPGCPGASHPAYRAGLIEPPVTRMQRAGQGGDSRADDQSVYPFVAYGVHQNFSIDTSFRATLIQGCCTT